ncbi:MAG: CocE/NonD family hydrolase [Nitratireductor sp.]|nr:CocE/NonD family hydrolase [Nitratireductor sp.]
MPDGVRLAARLWLPGNAEQIPVPAILEYIPYRKTDMVRARDERNHPYFAVHGFACLRVDMRGSGDSEGRMDDMYSDDELADARHVIEWIARQPWCNGNVGMFGTSWGGTASLQANIDAPEALKAVIAVCATHDRYEDDIHHMGGCLLTDTFEWGATLPAILAAPPTPNVGPQWKELWLQRLEGLSFPVEAWVREEARSAYWQHGSVIHQTDRLSRPVLAVGGWSDRYSNSVMSLVSARPDLVWGVVGPWGHHYPDHGHPGPAIGFQQLALEWWEYWLKPEGKMPDWPRLRVWLAEFDSPSDVIETRNGQWIESGPAESCTEQRVWHFADGSLTQSESSAVQGWSVPSDLRVGRASGDTGYFGRYGGLQLDQQHDDALALTVETAPLEEDVVLYGAARARLRVTAGSPLHQLSVRLNDVSPDGTSARVSLTVRNLALNDELDAPSELSCEEARRMDLQFHTKAYRFRKGHRIRLSIASSYWPIVWPSPTLGELHIAGGSLILPVYRGKPKDMERRFPPVLDLPATKTHRMLQNPALHRFQEEDNGELVSGWTQPFTELHFAETQTAYGFETRAEHRIARGDPNSAHSMFDHRARYTRPDGTAEIRCVVNAWCDDSTFFVEGSLTVNWEDEELSARQWNVSIPRLI